MKILQFAMKVADVASNTAIMTLEIVSNFRQITICNHDVQSRFEFSTNQNISSFSRFFTNNKQSFETATNKNDANNNN